MRKMKQIAALVVLGCAVLGTVGADPIGLTVGVDSFTFGNLLKTSSGDYEFAGKSGRGKVTPDIEFAQSFGGFSVWAQLKAPLSFKQNDEIPLWFKVQPGYTLGVGSGGKFAIIPRFQVAIPLEQGKTTVDDINPVTKEPRPREVDKVTEIAIDVIPQLKYTQTLGFGSLYINVPIAVSFNSRYLEDEMVISTGVNGKGVQVSPVIDSCDGLRIGATTNVGVYGFARLDMALYSDPDRDYDVVQEVAVRLGYNKLVDKKLDLYGTVYLPTYEDGFTKSGVTVDVRGTYTNSNPGFKAYLDLALGGLGKDKDADGNNVLTFTPSIGLFYLF